MDHQVRTRKIFSCGPKVLVLKNNLFIAVLGKQTRDRVLNGPWGGTSRPVSEKVQVIIPGHFTLFFWVT